MGPGCCPQMCVFEFSSDGGGDDDSGGGCGEDDLEATIRETPLKLLLFAYLPSDVTLFGK